MSLTKSTNIFGLNEKQVNQSLNKYELLEPIINKTLTDEEEKIHWNYVRKILKKSDRTIRRYLEKFKKSGIKLLSRKTRNDAGKYRVFSKEILLSCIKLIDENPSRSVAMIIELLKTDKSIKDQVEKISPSTFYYYLKKAGYNARNRPKKKNKKAFHRFEALFACELWQSDARDGIPIPDPDNPKKKKMTYCFLWMDDFSRKILFAKYYWDEKLPRLEDSFRQALLRYGRPHKILTDNGSVYISKNFHFQADELGIRVIHHKPYQPWGKGKVEFIMKILKRFQEEIRLTDIKTIEELNETLNAYIEVVYNNKIHSETGETPNNRFFNSIKKNPSRSINNLTFFNSLFLHRQEKVVDKYKKIRFNNNLYTVAGLGVGERIEIRYDPFDLTEIQVYYKNKYYSNLKAYKLTNKAVKNIPCELQKSKEKISKEATLYFHKLREKYQEIKKAQVNDVTFLNIKNNKENNKNDKSN